MKTMSSNNSKVQEIAEIIEKIEQMFKSFSSYQPIRVDQLSTASVPWIGIVISAKELEKLENLLLAFPPRLYEIRTIGERKIYVEWISYYFDDEYYYIIDIWVKVILDE